MSKARVIKIAVWYVLPAVVAAGIYIGATARTTYRAELERGILFPAGRLAVTAKRLDAANARAALTRGQRTLPSVAAQVRVAAMTFRGLATSAPAGGKAAPPSPQAMELLRIGRELAGQTQGAFDMAAGEVDDLWRRADRENRWPTAAQMDAARAAGGWDRVAFKGADVKFTGPPFLLDPSPAAGAFAADKAIHALQGEGVLGGLAQMSGAVRCFGTAEDGRGWRVAVPDPFAPDTSIATLALTEVGVCTFSSYDRLTLLDGRRVCVNADPRTGRLVEAPASATVVASSATLACGWARALTVLGPAGLRLIGGATGVEAMVVIGEKTNWVWFATPGFEKFLSSPLPARQRWAIPSAATPASAPAPASRPAPTTERRP